MCKVEKIRDYSSERLQILGKLLNFNVQKIVDLFRIIFLTGARTAYFEVSCHVSASFYLTVWRISSGKSDTFTFQARVKMPHLTEKCLVFVSVFTTIIFIDSQYSFFFSVECWGVFHLKRFGTMYKILLIWSKI